jgi:hypothetical protein
LTAPGTGRILVPIFVVPGVMPGTHVFWPRKDVDGRDKPGHDDSHAIAR